MESRLLKMSVFVSVVDNTFSNQDNLVVRKYTRRMQADMPRFSKIFGGIEYSFSLDREPIHVHVAKGRAHANTDAAVRVGPVAESSRTN